MGLASAKSVASWQTRGGTSDGAEAGMVLSYSIYSRKKISKISAPQPNVHFLVGDGGGTSGGAEWHGVFLTTYIAVRKRSKISASGVDAEWDIGRSRSGLVILRHIKP